MGEISDEEMGKNGYDGMPGFMAIVFAKLTVTLDSQVVGTVGSGGFSGDISARQDSKFALVLRKTCLRR